MEQQFAGFPNRRLRLVRLSGKRQPLCLPRPATCGERLGGRSPPHELRVVALQLLHGLLLGRYLVAQKDSKKQIKKIIFPKENESEIEEIPGTVRAELELVPAAHIDEVLMDALIGLDSKDFEKVLDRKVQRDEILFGESDSDEKEDDGKKESSGGVVAH